MSNVSFFVRSCLTYRKCYVLKATSCFSLKIVSIPQTLSRQRKAFRRPYVYNLRSVLMFFVSLFFSFLFISYLSSQWYHPYGVNNMYAICNPNNPQEPNNWLRSPVIEVGDIQRLDVTFRYSSLRCRQSASFCKESFYAYVWETNTRVTEQQIPHPINDSQLYRRFANITRQSDQTTNLTVSLHLSSKYIVLGIRDQGGCRTLYSVKVSYKVCDEKRLKDRLVFFPSMLAQVESTPVQVNCMANSRQIVPGNLTVLCDSDGEWNTSRLHRGCVCKDDMENKYGFCTGMGTNFDRLIFIPSYVFFRVSALLCLLYPYYFIVYFYYQYYCYCYCYYYYYYYY